MNGSPRKFIKRIALFILCAACAVVATMGVYLAIRPERFPLHRLPNIALVEKWRIIHTKNDVKSAHKAVQDFVTHYGRLPVNRPDREEQFSLTLGHELNGVNPGVGRQNTEGIVFWDLPAGDQKDPWMHRYNFYFDDDGDGVVHPPGGGSVMRSFVVWSNGPNGIDEGGGGDDIRDW